MKKYNEIPNIIMIEVEEQTNSDKSRRTLQFYLIDGHHHIGEDIDNHKNLTVNGSFDFFRSIWNIDQAGKNFWLYRVIGPI